MDNNSLYFNVEEYSSITLCILACAKNDKYKSRLKNFIDSYGYKANNTDIKLQIVFLVEDEPRPEFLQDDMMWYNCPNIPLSMRLLYFIKNEQCHTDWLMQVDDDSSTDIDKTIELLDSFYDKNDCLLLMGGRNTDLESGLQNIVRTMQYPNVFFGSSDISKFDTTPYFIHAWEPSILSVSAFKRIKAWSRLYEYYDLCYKYRPTFGDQVPYVAAKLSKVPIVECLFLSPFYKPAEYSAINKNGRFSHIHYVTEKASGYYDFINKIKHIKTEKINEINNIQNNNMWEFWAFENGQNRPISLIELLPDGKVGNYDHHNEKFWQTDCIEESITLLDGDRQPTCKLLYDHNNNEYVGEFVHNKKILHKLKKI